jgi:hypothetical protein
MNNTASLPLAKTKKSSNLPNKTVNPASLMLPNRQALTIHLFSAFMWAIAKEPLLMLMPTLRTCEEQDWDLREPEPEEVALVSAMYHIQDSATSMFRTPRFHFQEIQDIVEEVRKLGVGDQNAAGVLLGIVAPMSHAGQLPNEFVVSNFLAETLSDERFLEWDHVFPRYGSLLYFAQKRGKQDRFAQRAVTATLEFILQVAEKPLQTSYTNTSNPERLISELRDDIEKLDLVKDVIVWLGTVYKQQGRGNRYAQAMTALQNPQWDKSPEGNSVPEEVPWGFLHNADVLGWPERYRQLFRWGQGHPTELEVLAETELGGFCDITGQTMLHHFVNDLTDDEFDRVLELTEKNPYANRPRLLIGANSKPGRNGQRPLHRAAVTGKNSAASRLLAEGADLNATDNASRTPLFLAAWHGNYSICVTLLKQERIDINCCDRSDQTALHVAAMNGNQDVVKLLLQQKDIDPTLKDLMGETAEDLAVGAGHEEIANMIACASEEYSKDRIEDLRNRAKDDIIVEDEDKRHSWPLEEVD